jgi:hypothetical protein
VLLRLFAVRRAVPVGQQAGELYRQMRRALGWAGLRARTSVTPAEFLQGQGRRMDGYSLLSKALRQATALYQQAAFSDHPPETGRVHSAAEIWRQAFGQWLSLWWKNRRGGQG